MTRTRRNVLTDPASLEKFCRGVNLLKRDFSAGVTTNALGLPGMDLPVSAYDQFVIWHYVAMNILTPPPPAPNPNARNAAHRGSVFLPWHRFMLLLLEQHLQRVLDDDTFGLPYWDWAADGDHQPVGEQSGLALWKATAMGGAGRPVADGPFRFDPHIPKTASGSSSSKTQSRACCLLPWAPEVWCADCNVPPRPWVFRPASR